MEQGVRRCIFLAPCPAPPAPFPELSFHGDASPSHVRPPASTAYNATTAMMPVFPNELLITAVEMVCYFCTAVGVAVDVFAGVAHGRRTAE